MNARRRGFAAITVLVVLAVLTIVSSVVTLQMVSQRRFLQQREQRLQADNLARAGIEFAAARLLGSDAGFKEERTDWIPEGAVRIRATRAKDNVYSVIVEASVGPDEERSVRKTLTREFRRIEKGGSVRLEPLAVAAVQ